MNPGFSFRGGLINEELAEFYSKAGDMNYYADRNDIAIEYYTKAKDLYDIEYGEENLNSAYIYTSIQTVYLKLKNHEKQIEYLKKAIDIYEKVYGKEHHETLKWYDHLFRVYRSKWYNQDDYNALRNATAIAKQLAETNSKIYGEKSLEAAEYYNYAAILYKYLDDMEKCYYYTELTLTAYVDFPEENEHYLISFYDCLADGYVHFGDTALAIDLLKKAQLICENTGDMEQLEVIKKEISELE